MSNPAFFRSLVIALVAFPGTFVASTRAQTLPPAKSFDAVYRFTDAGGGQFKQEEGVLSASGFTSSATVVLSYGITSIFPTAAEVAAVNGVTLVSQALWQAETSDLGAAYFSNFTVSSNSYTLAGVPYLTIAWNGGGTSTGGGSTGTTPASGQLINLSILTTVPAGGSLTAGFVVNQSSLQVLVRAAGPALSAFGVGNPLSQTTLTVFNSSGVAVATNSGWSSTSANQTAILGADKATGAFDYTAGSNDSAVVLTLAPGSYSVQVSGGNGAPAGQSLVEVYSVPNP